MYLVRKLDRLMAPQSEWVSSQLVKTLSCPLSQSRRLWPEIPNTSPFRCPV